MAKHQALTLIVAIIIAGVVGVFGYQYGTKGKVATSTSEVLPNKPYQSVFLSNGQVYFGKVTARTPTFTTLRDVYYLQVQQPLQPVDSKQTSQPSNSTGQAGR